MQVTSSTAALQLSTDDPDRARQLEQDRRRSQNLRAQIATLERYAADIDKQKLPPAKAKELRDQTQKKIDALKAQLEEAERRIAKQSSPSETNETGKKKSVGKNKKNSHSTAVAADDDDNANTPPYSPGSAAAQKRDARNGDKSELSVSDTKQAADLSDLSPTAENQRTRASRKNKSAAQKHAVAADVYDIKGKTVASQKGLFVDTEA
ncbi:MULTISPECIES: hypothetical protein [unclassified Herbaspirillum]|uniref:hypothetical protein n=1 Tax=unclassified Herbaspirillum TaxID=2624150 RepID=UPI000E2F1DA7|nr:MULTISPECIES: hypothetical protein [unclassified Herbaspirillum]RFB73570.1 hypothetical protein DZB54_04510 [Herbaspirillum sp. 3R-3a1]TFI10628.1 hypothetical protein E4P32_03655 [Herbaspirillum sp. 3R11]TFI16534.1 hypothetical protein E4P31_03660 [Herbaspirillum sp. 3R-11]TFI23759.1 hypothetical protein E4P30_16640 [Herbaspirillum sp. 3C11]